MEYEYFAIAAPNQTKRKKGENTAAEHLASVMTEVMNEFAQAGWEYLRSETLSVMDKRHRFASTEERVETILIFRRPLDAAEPMAQRTEPEPRESAVYESAPVEMMSRLEEPPQNLEVEEDEYEEEEELVRAPSLGGATRD